MRWFAQRAEEAGAAIRRRALFRQAGRLQSGFDLGEFGTTRFLVGADGPTSAVAKTLGLGQSRKFRFGVEHEFTGVELPDPDKLHCFIDRRLAPGYIGWLAAAPGGAQVGLARRLHHRGRQPTVEAIKAFLDKIASIVDLRDAQPTSVRAGLIPSGGVVAPVAGRRVLLTGDAAGMVSPVTAGGIHNALKHGLAAGHAISDYLSGKREDPSTWFVSSYPRFRVKRLLRFLFDTFQSDFVFNLLLNTRAVRAAASVVYFHHKGVFDPEMRDPELRRADAGGSNASRA